MMSSARKGLGVPDLRAKAKDLLSIMKEGRKNLFKSSERHCLRMLAGRMRRMRRWPEAQSWERTIPPSIVLPSPVSSARRVPRDSGEERAKIAASIW